MVNGIDRYIKAPKDEVGEEEKTRQEVARQHKTEEAAFGTYASEGGTKFNYRVKKGGAFGGYKIISESTNNSMSREELLNMRSKKKSDRLVKLEIARLRLLSPRFDSL